MGFKNDGGLNQGFDLGAVDHSGLKMEDIRNKLFWA